MVSDSSTRRGAILPQMIRSAHGDIFESSAEALVNPVNCVGVMGKGLALAFKRRFPEMFREYAAVCKAGELVPGTLHVWRGSGAGPMVINVPTKRHFRSKSKLEDVEAGLVALRETALELGLRSVAVPALGAGLGGLRWSEVRPRIVATFEGVEGLEVELFEPQGVGRG